MSGSILDGFSTEPTLNTCPIFKPPIPSSDNSRFIGIRPSEVTFLLLYVFPNTSFWNCIIPSLLIFSKISFLNFCTLKLIKPPYVPELFKSW